MASEVALASPSEVALAATAFGSAEDQREFADWLDARFSTYPCAESFPQITAKAKAALARWRLALPKAVWRRFWKDNEKSLKEINECCPIVARLLDYVAERSPDAPPVSIVDLCSGFGFLSLLLSELLDPAAVSAIHLVDRRWPMRGQPRADDGQQSTEHIEAGCWRIPLFTRKVDIKRGREQRQLTQHLFGRARGPVVLLGVHLCGGLSCCAVTLWNDNPNIGFLALKPCCLPGKASVQHGMQWTLGTHSFTAAQVYSGEDACKPCDPPSAGPASEQAAPSASAAEQQSAAEAPAGQPGAEPGAEPGAAPGAAAAGAAQKKRREKDSGRRHRSVEAAQRRELKRKQQLSERRQQRAAARDPAAASSAKPAPPAEKVAHGRRLLRAFGSNLLRGVESAGESELRGEGPPIASLEEHEVQPHHFQNLFLFAQRPEPRCTPTMTPTDDRPAQPQAHA